MTFSLRVMIIAGNRPYVSHYFQFLCWKTQNPVSTTYGFRVLCLIHSCGVITHCRVKQVYHLIKLHLWCPRLKKRWPFAVRPGDLPSFLMAIFCKMPACGWGWPWVGASVSSWHISSFVLFVCLLFFFFFFFFFLFVCLLFFYFWCFFFSRK